MLGSARVLFVCTGNIFRSLTADMALRRLLEGRKGFHVSSAGTEDYPLGVRPYTQGNCMFFPTAKFGAR